MLKKLFTIALVATFIAACGPGTEEQTPVPDETPMNDMDQNGDNGDITPGETDENLNREQIEDDILPDDNNNN